MPIPPAGHPQVDEPGEAVFAVEEHVRQAEIAVDDHVVFKQTGPCPDALVDAVDVRFSDGARHDLVKLAGAMVPLHTREHVGCAVGERAVPDAAVVEITQRPAERAGEAIGMRHELRADGGRTRQRAHEQTIPLAALVAQGLGRKAERMEEAKRLVLSPQRARLSRLQVIAAVVGIEAHGEGARRTAHVSNLFGMPRLERACARNVHRSPTSLPTPTCGRGGRCRARG